MTSEEQESKARWPDRRPANSWLPWTAPAALLGGLVLAAFGAVLAGIIAAVLGANLDSSHLSGGLTIGLTAVQDAAFVAAAVIFAQVGGRTVRAWQFGLRLPKITWRVVVGAVAASYLAFFAFDVVWALLLNVHEKEKLLETLGANEGPVLLVLSALLTCMIAPICEEFLFRGFIFAALSNWRGPGLAAVITGLVFGAVHVGSAPAEDLVPLAVLGFALCLLYRASGSLYPCIALHALNNSIAFGSLEGWWWVWVLVLIAATLGLFALIATTLSRLGVFGAEPAAASVASEA